MIPLHLVYVGDYLKTPSTFFPIEPLPVHDPFHPDHPDNNEPKQSKAGGTASKRVWCKSSSLKLDYGQSPTSTPSKKVPSTPYKADDTNPEPPDEHTQPKEPIRKKWRLKLCPKKPSAPKSSAMMLKTPSPAAPHIQPDQSQRH